MREFLAYSTQFILDACASVRSGILVQPGLILGGQGCSGAVLPQTEAPDVRLSDHVAHG